MVYPLRFFAAAIVLWHYRSQYRELEWKPGWFGPLVGVPVFVMWLLLDMTTNERLTSNLGSELAKTSIFFRRVSWLTLRVLAAVVTVPIAEELAFSRISHPWDHVARLFHFECPAMVPAFGSGRVPRFWPPPWQSLDGSHDRRRLLCSQFLRRGRIGDRSRRPRAN
jgi:hypothetical protein